MKVILESKYLGIFLGIGFFSAYNHHSSVFFCLKRETFLNYVFHQGMCFSIVISAVISSDFCIRTQKFIGIAWMWALLNIVKPSKIEVVTILVKSPLVIQSFKNAILQKRNNFRSRYCLLKGRTQCAEERARGEGN